MSRPHAMSPTLSSASPSSTSPGVVSGVSEPDTHASPAGRTRSGTAPAMIEVWGTTCRGRVRKANEDHFLVAELDRGLGVRGSNLESSSLQPAGATVTESPQGLLLAVADGVGGRAGGAIASAIAVETMAHYVLTVMPWVFDTSDPDDNRLEEWISEALRRTQRKMRRVAERRGIDPRMATTFTMAYVTWPHLLVAHVGDSRCYLERDDTLRRLTVDHTMAQQMIEQGHLDPAKAKASPFEHMLINSLGGSSEELWVELHRIELEPGDQLLLCSDGLTGHLDDDELRDHLTRGIARGRTIEETVNDLVACANARGGKDNITAVLARF